MSDEVIKSFMVALGFKTDTRSETRFKESVEKASKITLGLGAAIAAASAAILASVTKSSAAMEQLYYASQRIGASVENINAATFSIGQVGGSAQGARNSLEALASFMRSSPGSEGFIRNLGVQTRDANGQLLQTTDIFRGIEARLKAMPYYRAKAIAGVLGIDENTMQAGFRDDGGGAKAIHKMYRAAGLDAQQAAKGAAAFMNQMRLMGAALGILGDDIAAHLTGGLSDDLDHFRTRFVANFGRISEVITEVSRFILELADGFLTFFLNNAHYVEAAIDWFNRLGAGIARWRKDGKTLINWGEWGPGVNQALAAFDHLEKALVTLWPKVKPYLLQMLDFMGHVFLTSITNAVNSLGDLAEAVSMAMDGDWKDARNKMKQAVGDWMGVSEDQAPTTLGASPLSFKGLQANEASGVRALMQMGLTQAQAAGLIANFEQESGLDPNRIGDNGTAKGIGQWHKDRRDAILKGTGIDVWGGTTFDQQLKAAMWELGHTEQAANIKLLGSGTAEEAAANVSRYYERPFYQAAEMHRRAQMATAVMARMNRPLGAFTQTRVSAAGTSAIDPDVARAALTMNTTITVNGSGDPHLAAKRTAERQQAVGQNLIRYMSPAAL